MREIAIVVAVVVVLAIVAVVLAVLAWRRSRAGFETHALAPERAQAFEARLEEAERRFVDEPRESVAAARQTVDEMLSEMGYPARLARHERVRDLRHSGRDRADGYEQAAVLRDGASTEEMRRALKSWTQMGRELAAESWGRTATTTVAAPPRREIAG